MNLLIILNLCYEFVRWICCSHFKFMKRSIIIECYVTDITSATLTPNAQNGISFTTDASNMASYSCLNEFHREQKIQSILGINKLNLDEKK